MGLTGLLIDFFTRLDHDFVGLSDREFVDDLLTTLIKIHRKNLKVIWQWWHPLKASSSLFHLFNIYCFIPQNDL